jgi:uncharacterized repeat protein (TIGR01451 family)
MTNPRKFVAIGAITIIFIVTLLGVVALSGSAMNPWRIASSVSLQEASADTADPASENQQDLTFDEQWDLLEQQGVLRPSRYPELLALVPSENTPNTAVSGMTFALLPPRSEGERAVLVADDGVYSVVDAQIAGQFQIIPLPSPLFTNGITTTTPTLLQSGFSSGGDIYVSDGNLYLNRFGNAHWDTVYTSDISQGYYPVMGGTLHQGVVYVATTNGIWRMGNDGWEKVIADGEYWSLLSLGDTLYAGGRNEDNLPFVAQINNGAQSAQVLAVFDEEWGVVRRLVRTESSIYAMTTNSVRTALRQNLGDWAVLANGRTMSLASDDLNQVLVSLEDGKLILFKDNNVLLDRMVERPHREALFANGEFLVAYSGDVSNLSEALKKSDPALGKATQQAMPSTTTICNSPDWLARFESTSASWGTIVHNENRGGFVDVGVRLWAQERLTGQAFDGLYPGIWPTGHEAQTDDVAHRQNVAVNGRITTWQCDPSQSDPNNRAWSTASVDAHSQRNGRNCSASVYGVFQGQSPMYNIAFGHLVGGGNSNLNGHLTGNDVEIYLMDYGDLQAEAESDFRVTDFFRRQLVNHNATSYHFGARGATFENAPKYRDEKGLNGSGGVAFQVLIDGSWVDVETATLYRDQQYRFRVYAQDSERVTVSHAVRPGGDPTNPDDWFSTWSSVTTGGSFVQVWVDVDGKGGNAPVAMHLRNGSRLAGWAEFDYTIPEGMVDSPWVRVGYSDEAVTVHNRLTNASNDFIVGSIDDYRLNVTTQLPAPKPDLVAISMTGPNNLVVANNTTVAEFVGVWEVRDVGHTGRVSGSFTFNQENDNFKYNGLPLESEIALGVIKGGATTWLTRDTTISTANNIPSGGQGNNRYNCTLSPGGFLFCATSGVQLAIGDRITLRARRAINGDTLVSDAPHVNTVSSALYLRGAADSSSSEDNNTNNLLGYIPTVQKRIDLAVAVAAVESPVAVGDPVAWNVSMNNPGALRAHGVELTITYPQYLSGVTITQGVGNTCSHIPANRTVTCTRGSLNAGATSTVSISATSDPLAARSYELVASIRHTPARVTDTNLTNNTARATITTEVGTITGEKTDRQDPVEAGQNVTWDMTVTNTGNVVVRKVSIVDPLPAGLTFVSSRRTGAVAGNCSQSTSGGITTATCLFDIIDPGETAQMELVALVPESYNQPTVVNEAQVWRGGNVDFRVNETTNITRKADLSISIIDSKDPVYRGETFAYMITVRNLSGVTTSGFRMTYPIPFGLAVESVVENGWNCTYTAPNLACIYPSNLPVGSTTPEVVVNVTLSDIYPEQTYIYNTASVAPATGFIDPDMSNNQDTEDTYVDKKETWTLLPPTGFPYVHVKFSDQLLPENGPGMGSHDFHDAESIYNPLQVPVSFGFGFHQDNAPQGCLVQSDPCPADSIVVGTTFVNGYAVDGVMRRSVAMTEVSADARIDRVGNIALNRYAVSGQSACTQAMGNCMAFNVFSPPNRFAWTSPQLTQMVIYPTGVKSEEQICSTGADSTTGCIIVTDGAPGVYRVTGRVFLTVYYPAIDFSQEFVIPTHGYFEITAPFVQPLP